MISCQLSKAVDERRWLSATIESLSSTEKLSAEELPNCRNFRPPAFRDFNGE
jgi:hypothetical protein